MVDQVAQGTYHRAMGQQVIIEEGEMTPEMARLFEEAERNMVWLSEHAEELEIFKRHRGRYVAAAGGELFVAESGEEVRRLARAKHPDEMPHLRYACQPDLAAAATWAGRVSIVIISLAW